MGLKVAICGLWGKTRHLIPWGVEGWELWGMPWDAEFMRMHRSFEMHDACDWKKYASTGYVDRLKCAPRLYLQRAHPELPEATVFPFDDVAKVTGDDWSSSIGYMLALAIYEGAEEILLCGVSMESTEEYAYQRPNVAYLIGLARGRGITVHIPDECSLCKHRGEFGYIGRYGNREGKQ